MTFDAGRRKLLGALVGLPVLGRLAVAGEEAKAGKANPVTPIVARARRQGLLNKDGTLHPGKLDDALGSALTRAGGGKTPAEAMRRLFRPTDVVGLKVNCLAGRGLSPSPLLVKRLCDWLQEAGLPARNLVIWDRTDRELEAAGFPIARSGDGVHCAGVNQDYDWTPREWGAGASCFARMLVKEFTALINIGVLKDHDLSGVSVGLKNWYGAIHNPNKHHDEGCAPFIPHLAAYPLIRDKLRLTVIDGSTAQCHGGPARNPRWTWPHESVLVSTDPVAVDAVGWRTIEERRREVKLPSLAEEKREPVWIAAAAKLGLGEADPVRFRVEDV